MTMQLQVPDRVDEPCDVKEYADMITRVVSEGEAIVVRRAGTDVAAIVPLEYLELMQEAVANAEAERLTKTIDWKQLAKTSPPPQAWFDGEEPKPF